MILLALLLAQTNPATPPTDSPQKPPPAPVTWSGTVALGLIALTGNSKTLTFSTNSEFERRSPDWIWGIKTFAAYGRNTAGGASTAQVTALRTVLADLIQTQRKTGSERIIS